jgi:hypothetical protein
MNHDLGARRATGTLGWAPPAGDERPPASMRTALPTRTVIRTRLEVYSCRLWHTFLGGLKHNCCFMHVPKCAGSSVSHALRGTVRLQDKIGNIEAVPSRIAAALVYDGELSESSVHEDGPRCAEIFRFRRALLSYYMAAGCALVFGHVLYDKQIFAQHRAAYKYISILREPTSRVISNFRSARFEGFIDEPFPSYLSSDVAWRHATVALRYFSGMPEVPPGEVATALLRAKENMRTFDLVGFAEDLSGFRARFADLFGPRPLIFHHNAGRLTKPDVDGDTRRRLEALCEPDREIYDYARRLFA